MEICVFNHGCTHPYLRTYALSKYCDIGLYVDYKYDEKNVRILEDKKIKVLILDNTKSFSFWRIYKKVKTLDFDSYIVHFASGAFLYATVLSKKRPLINVAMGNDILNTEGDGKIGKIKMMLNKRMIKKSDLIIAKSNLIKKRLIEWGVKSPIIVNYWGVNKKVFQRKNQIKSKNLLDLPLDKKIILSPRSFENRCNLHLILEAFAKLVSEDDSLFLVFIYGNNNTEYYTKIKNRIFELGINDHVRIDNSVSVDKIVDYYSACDLAISFAKSDGFPNSVLEMMYCKVPLIVGNIPHIKDLLQDNVNSFLCELDSDVLYEKLKMVIRLLGSDKLKHITDNAYNEILRTGDIEKNAEIIYENIKNLEVNKKKKNLLVEWTLLILYFIFRKLKIES